jgi:hypothetical protein
MLLNNLASSMISGSFLSDFMGFSIVDFWIVDIRSWSETVCSSDVLLTGFSKSFYSPVSAGMTGDLPFSCLNLICPTTC